MKPKFSLTKLNDFDQIEGSIKVTISSSTHDVSHDFLDFIIENRPTSQCHVVTFGHLITFDQWKYLIAPQTMQKGWILMHLSHDFQALIKFERCQILPQR